VGRGTTEERKERGGEKRRKKTPRSMHGFPRIKEEQQGQQSKNRGDFCRAGARNEEEEQERIQVKILPPAHQFTQNATIMGSDVYPTLQSFKEVRKEGKTHTCLVKNKANPVLVQKSEVRENPKGKGTFRKPEEW